MKSILVYGDSNTWGFNPATTGRYPPQIRWTGVMRAALDASFPGACEVVAEGQNGRTTVWDDPLGDKNGATHIMAILESHKPLDLVIIMLGTNDLKHRIGVSAYDVARGLCRLGDLVRKSEFGPGNQAPEILLVAPPPFATLSSYSPDFLGGAEKSRDLGRQLAAVAPQYNHRFFDAGSVIVSSDIDGIHLDPSEHEKLGKAMALEAARILSL